MNDLGMLLATVVDWDGTVMIKNSHEHFDEVTPQT